MPNILFSSPGKSNGLAKHLIEASKIVPSSQFVNSEEFREMVRNNDSNKNPNLIVFGGDWILDEKNLLKNFKHSKKGILFCSPYSQAEITSEVGTLVNYLDLLKSGEIDYLFVGPTELKETLDHPRIKLFPAPFSDNSYGEMKNIMEKIHKNYSKERRTVSILNDKASHKNILNTLIGVKESSAEKLIINGVNQEYNQFINLIGLNSKIDNVGFLDKNSLYSKMAISGLGMHLSYSEGFAYNILEYLLLGTNCLVSQSTPWFSSDNRTLIQKFEDTREISSKIDYIINLSDSEYSELHTINCKNALNKVDKNNSIVKNTFREFE